MTRLFVSAAIISLTALTASTVWSGPSEAPILEGAVKQRLTLDGQLLKSFPPVTINITFETGQGKRSGRYKGALLWSLIESAGLRDTAGKNPGLRHTLLVTGRDGYAVALAFGEIDPHYEGKSVLLAYEEGEPPVSVSALRLVVPGDAHGGRSVRDVVRIEVR